MTAVTRPGWRSPYLWLAIVFLVSRAAYAAAGIVFDARPLGEFFQFLDPELLKHDLMRSVFYMHTQPPGLNLFAGIVLKLFPESYAAVFHGVYMLCGLVTGWSVYALMRLLSVRQALAFALTSLFLISPGLVLFENLLIYEYPLLALGCLSALALGLAVERNSQKWLAACLLTLAAMCVIRATYHLVYYVLILAAIWLAFPKLRRSAALAGGLGFLVIFGLYAKNAMLYGQFNSSTWMGFNIATITLGHIDDAKKQEFVKQGLISPVSLIPAPSPLQYYKPYIQIPPPTGIPLLDREADSTGRPNFNDSAYAQVRAYYMKDGKALLRHYPICYAKSVATAWFAYFLPTGDFPFFQANREKIYGWDRAWNLLAFGQWNDASDRKALRRAVAASPASVVLYTGIFLAVGLPILWIFAAYLLWRKRSELSSAQVAVLAFMLFNILFLTAVSNFLSSFENNRYRLPLDGFHVVLLGLAVNAVWNRLQPRTV